MAKRSSVQVCAAVRRTLAGLLLAGLCASSSCRFVGPNAPVVDLPVTGKAVPELAGFDSVMVQFLKTHRVPGGALAIAYQGRLVFARGYGLADVAAGLPVAPDALFRIASVSKPITAVATLKLVEEGRLHLDDRPFSMLGLAPPPGAKVDPRIYDVTVYQLLCHSGGWDRDQSFDPMFRSVEAARAVGAPAPASAETIVRYMMGQKLDFTPGSRFTYSNFGYCVLGRVIEHVTGQSYEDYVKTDILAPMGIHRMQIGRTKLSGRAPDEVKYYAPGRSFGSPLAASVFPGEGRVPEMYGGFYLEAMDASGGWIASVVDLMRFATAVDGQDTRPDLLKRSTTDQMVALPPGAPHPQGAYYALGWHVTPSHDGVNWWHDGYLTGTSALLVRSYHGMAWAVLLNAFVDPMEGMADLDRGLWRSVHAVTAWPSGDLFSTFR